jgi:hypothetical protein
MKKAYHHAVDGTPLNVVKNTSEHTGQLLVAIHPHPNQRLWMGNSATFVKFPQELVND